MSLEKVHFSTAQIEPHLAIWMDALGRVNASRLSKLVPVFSNGAASLGDALAIVAPGKERKPALAAFQTFVGRANDAAVDAGLELAIRVDSKKRTDPDDRLAWVEGPSPDVENLAQYTREATSTLDRQQLVPPIAAILTSEEHENLDQLKPLIRFFVSYAHADDKSVSKLLDSLEKELRLSKQFRFEVWSDRKIVVGADWDTSIQDALDSCHFGLLFVSREFLLSSYISKKELPRFVDGDKPVVPVGLKPLDFSRVELKGLKSKQIFRHTRVGEDPRFFTKCRGGMAEDFVRELATDIETKVAEHLASLQTVSVTRSNRKIEKGRLEEDEFAPVVALGKKIVGNIQIPSAAVPPDAAPTDLSSIEKNSSRLSNSRTLAIEYLSEWVIRKDSNRFCAVLGEVGIGKTTALMMLARELDRLRETDATVPAAIFVDLKDYYFEGDPTLTDILNEVITRHWKGEANKAVTPEMIIRAVRERGALIIFDGLDERIIPLPQQRRDAFIRQLWSILPPLSQKPKPGIEPGRLIISCRSHYFPTVTALSSAFTGEGREGVKQSDYTACVILPFSDDQVRTYLTGMLGEDRVDDAIAVIKSVHNLTDLSTRPFLLSLIVPELAELEQMKKEGRSVFGVTLYGLFVEKWLRRDEYKHQFTPEHKLLMMEALAGHLCKLNQKTLPWRKVSEWLDGFLQSHPEIRERYKNKPAEVLNQDFRAATFCLRPDDEKDGFRFAHTSLYEYFLAIKLVRALEKGTFGDWDLPLPSDEAFEFAGQLIAGGEAVDSQLAVENWTCLLDSPDSPNQARLNAFRLWLVAHQKGWPQPVPASAQLHELNLEEWKIGSSDREVLDLRSANFASTCLDHADIRNVLLTECNCSGVSARHAQIHESDLRKSTWAEASFCGATIRRCQMTEVIADTASWHDCDVIDCVTVNAELPADWKLEAAAQVEKQDSWDLELRKTHSGSVHSVCWSPDGSRVLSGGSDGSVKIWDSSSGRCLQTFEGHTGWVFSVCWSPDGSRVLSGGGDGSVKIWDSSSGRCLQTFEGHRGWVRSVCWSPDGSRVLSGGGDGSVKIWDSSSGRCLQTFEGHRGWVRSVCWSPDGSRVLSGGRDCSVKIWDSSSGRCLQTFEGHGGWVRSVCWSPDGSRVLSGGDDGSVKIWDSSSGRCLQTFEGHGDWVFSVCWSPDGSRVLSGGDDGSVKIWDSSSGRCLQTFEGHGGWVLSVCWSPDGSRVLSGGGDGSVKIWDSSSGRCLQTFEGHRGWVRSVCWSPDGSRVLSGGGDGSVKIWDSSSGRCLQTFEGHGGWVLSVCWSPDGSRVLSGGDDSSVKIWDSSSGRCLQTFEGHGGGVRSVCWSPDGSRVLSGGDDSSVKIWDSSSGRCLQTFEGHGGGVRSVCWSPDGSRVLSGGGDGSVKIWDSSSGRCLQTFEGHTGGVLSVCWSPDGSRVLSGGDDGSVKIWDSSSGRCLQTFEGHGGWVLSVCWSPDGSRVLSGGDDGSVKIWDSSSGRCLQTFEGHSGGVRSVCWSPDGSRVLSSGGDSTIREWNANTGGLIRTWVISGDEVALVDLANNEILHATPEAWRLIAWTGFDSQANRRRQLPAEIFGALPPW